jgi:peroxiredoxin Q/BCP
VVLFFYPKDETFGCIKEVCAFRDQYTDFVAAGCQVVGISGDSVASHRAFAQNHRLPYPLLSDPQGVARAGFGVTPTLGLFPGRVTFVIDSGGVVRHTFSGQFNIKGHVERALQVVRQLQAERP